VAALVELLFSEDAILSSMQAAHIKVDELPLGAVTVDRVLRCSALLEAIRSHLETSQTQAPREGAVWQAQLEQFSTDFFQQLPCRDVQLIKTEADLAAREATVNLLMDVAVGQGLLTKAGKNGAAAVASSLSSLSSSSSLSPSASASPLELHALDQKAQSLECDLVAVAKDSEVFRTIAAAFTNTATPVAQCSLAGFHPIATTAAAAFPSVTEVFEMQRHGEHARFALNSRFASTGNVQLLWHGTNVAAGAAIVSGGLRIMPGAGGRLGQGLYFANEAGKSGHYVVAAPDGSALLFLAEVALGTSHTVTRDSSDAARLRAGKLPPQCDSSRALGRCGPPSEGDIHLDLGGGRLALLATASPVVRREPDAALSSSFNHDEFVVYREEQVRLRYCVRIHF
jgi:hypothetical protein